MADGGTGLGQSIILRTVCDGRGKLSANPGEKNRAAAAPQAPRTEMSARLATLPAKGAEKNGVRPVSVAIGRSIGRAGEIGAAPLCQLRAACACAARSIASNCARAFSGHI